MRFAPLSISHRGSKVEPFVVRVEDTEAGTRREQAFLRSPVRIGRSARNDVVATEPFVSAWHAVVEFDERGVRYTDLGSTNGSLVDGAPVQAGSPTVVEAGSEVTIGTLRLTFPARGGRGDATAATARLDSQAARPVRPGALTGLLRQLARAPSARPDQAWGRVLLPGAVIDRFELVREIGRGGFGVVFEARDRQLGRLVAFKAVRPGRRSQVGLREDRLQKEAEAVARLSHPNIVTLHDIGACDSGPYLVFELLRGETLRARLERGPLPWLDAVDVAIEVARALEHAHGAGVVHRDLKPSNVMLCREERVKLLDFGIARAFGGDEAEAFGTPSYMAPEQWLGEQQDARADVFAAGALLFESGSGRLPYRASRTWSAALEQNARPELDAPGLDRRLARLLASALSPRREERPAHGGEWLAALEQHRARLAASGSM